MVVKKYSYPLAHSGSLSCLVSVFSPDVPAWQINCLDVLHPIVFLQKAVEGQKLIN